MAISLVTKTTDTSTGVSPATLTVAALNFAKDYRVRSENADQAILTNITAPTSYSELARIGFMSIKDIYSNDDAEKSLWLPTRQGFQFMTELKTHYGVADSADATYEASLPVTSRLTVRGPNNGLITPSVVLAHIERMLALLYETGSTTTARLAGLMRGVMKPTDL